MQFVKPSSDDSILASCLEYWAVMDPWILIGRSRPFFFLNTESWSFLVVGETLDCWVRQKSDAKNPTHGRALAQAEGRIYSYVVARLIRDRRPRHPEKRRHACLSRSQHMRICSTQEAEKRKQSTHHTIPPYRPHSLKRTFKRVHLPAPPITVSQTLPEGSSILRLE